MAGKFAELPIQGISIPSSSFQLLCPLSLTLVGEARGPDLEDPVFRARPVDGGYPPVLGEREQADGEQVGVPVTNP